MFITSISEEREKIKLHLRCAMQHPEDSTEEEWVEYMKAEEEVGLVIFEGGLV
jgi:hypothetical protein